MALRLDPRLRGDDISTLCGMKAVDLCHTITLDQSLSLTHAIYVKDVLLRMPPEQILMKPCKLSFSPRFFAALVQPNIDLLGHFLIESDISVALCISIVDDLEAHPLLLGQTGARSLLLLGEILTGIVESVTAFGFKPQRLLPDPKDNTLTVEFVVPRDLYSSACVGAAVCIATVIDSLLFERGLKVATSHLLITNEESSRQSDFINILKRILAI